MATKITRKDRRRAKQRKKLKRARREEARLTAKGMQTVRKRHENRFGVPICGPVEGMPKLSDVIKEFAAPLIDGAEAAEEIEGGISMAVLVWNLAVVPGDVRKKMLRDLAAERGGDGEAAVIQAVIGDMLARKKALFDDDKRFVLDHEVTRIGPDDCHLAVAYAMFK